MKNLLCVGLVGLVALAGCGGDEPHFGPETDPTPAQETTINSSAQYLTLIANAGVQGEAAAGAALAFAFSSQSLVGGVFAQSPPELSARRSIARLAGDGSSAALGDCAVVSDTSVVWDHCVDENGEINGTLSWSPGHVDIDLEVRGSASGVQFSWSLTGSMTVSETALQADLTSSFAVTGGGSNQSETVHSQIDVELADGCITSGTLTVTATGSGQGARSGAVQVVWTGCNVFRVRNG